MSFDVRVKRKLGRFALDQEFHVGPGLTVLFGPSGSGKTSILNMIAGLLRPDEGQIAIGGTILFDSAARVDVPPEGRRVGYVFQDDLLFPHRKVGANLHYGYKLAPAAARWMASEHAIEMLGIGHLLDRWPASLSGGEAQRVAIGRALLSGPRALLMDEPLSSLDEPRRQEIMAVIEQIRDELRIPILYVTHDRSEAERLASSMIMIGGR